MAEPGYGPVFLEFRLARFSGNTKWWRGKREIETAITGSGQFNNAGCQQWYRAGVEMLCLIFIGVMDGPLSAI